ncbi:MAG: C25 family cysteine peptidase, partial [Ginsengibacter sp.]
EMNDGKKDSRLYAEPDYQLSDHWSLETDTAAYFITINTTGNNLRYVSAVNNISGNTLAPEPYFMNTAGTYYKGALNLGFAVKIGFNIYSSSYDVGEGYTSGDIKPGSNYSTKIETPNLYTAGPAASMFIAAAGNAENNRRIKIKLFETGVLDEDLSNYAYIKKSLANIPLSTFTNPDVANISVQNTSPVTIDGLVLSTIAITYPSKFNFSGKSSFTFELPATTTGNYLVIDNFKTSGITPLLYDLTSGRRYIGDLSLAGKVQFVLPASTLVSRKFVLTSQSASNIKLVTALEQRQFLDFSAPANQGDYIIISNPLLYNDGSGNNYIEQYSAYRKSVTGGSFNCKIYNIDELTDQFAWGIKKHPLGIKDFVQYAYKTFAEKPKFVFLIGKGILYTQAKNNESNPLVNRLNLVPTFGYPASDVSLVSDYESVVPSVPVGRLSVVSGAEVGNYLEKMKEYEAAQMSTSQAVKDKAWMKNVIHVIGGKDSAESALFKAYMEKYKAIIQDTFYGAKVETFAKTTQTAVETISSERIQNLFKEGLSLVSYFGHSSANVLEFNLNSPESYQNQGKYPFFNVSGCTAGNNYIYDTLRFSGKASLSEKYVLTASHGSIGFLASTHFGVPPFLNIYNRELYKNISVTNYGKSIGEQMQSVIKSLGTDFTALDYLTKIHLEELTLHGDPALKINSHPRPDYVVETGTVNINPNIISVADNNFNVSVKILNIGKAVNDSIKVEISRTMPNDSTVTLFDTIIPPVKYADSFNIDVSINPVTDRGINKITVSIDSDNRVEEMSEINNTVTREFFIFEDAVKPILPAPYSIVNKNGIKFYGSTANPLSPQRDILFEIDTTELFNSAFKRSLTQHSSGGVIEFSPPMTFSDSTVYYWRLGNKPDTGNIVWSTSSFVYLPSSTTGYNQSHYHQFLHNTSSQLIVANDRSFRFKNAVRSLTIRTGIRPFYDFDRINVSLNTDYLETYGCNLGSLQILVYDSSSLQPWANTTVNGAGLHGSAPTCTIHGLSSFEFPYKDPAYRKKAIDFLDSIPAGYYVSITNFGTNTNTSFIKQWMADTASLGSDNSLYHKLKAIGFTDIDSFYKNRPFLYIYQKGNKEFFPLQFVGLRNSDQIDQSFSLPGRFSTGEMESPIFGPAKNWKNLTWQSKSVETKNTDINLVEIYGLDMQNKKVKLATVYNLGDTTLSFINAATYPYLILKLKTHDDINTTPTQLQYWRVTGDYLPEGAIAPNIFFKMKDTLALGENIDFAVAFKNISEAAFDSLKLKFIITDRNNVPHEIVLPRQKPLISGDTLTVTYTIDTHDYLGTNTLFVDVNPDNDQPEQTHSNNFIYKNFVVRGDNINPLLDVTFDGIHILNEDIVSSRPHILIKLEDESKSLALNDTAFLKVQIRYPDGTLKDYRFDNDTVKFTPANLSTGQNTATIDFTPVLEGDDAEYELLVFGKDVSGNKAGGSGYKVNFRVFSKPMISNLLNYPNPFTTSTAFVFTITGYEIPQNLRIQILTITGKVVREIKREELGPLNIGRNITQFKWDGNDMYGQRLANGVYLYRVLTNLNGKSMEKYKAQGDKTDQYFTKGYGKMYLLK